MIRWKLFETSKSDSFKKDLNKDIAVHRSEDEADRYTDSLSKRSFAAKKSVVYL